ncbi:MAG: RNA recognition motif domain-containing protein [Nostoc sp. SerVER01]|uniref:RNA recognition motif domain-containing protein n=1 Tax=Nostoc sp. CCY 9925 TaxID=3103865 RepID=UPI002AD70FD0|nr:RNA-binding protein [Nostoc sp. SerVER01]MDZ8025393.1 RNA-binding protein [Nostoc sp. DedQUE11]MDZ8075189.1 RNA-binding protein [Nostoc sp. DedQUE01]MDZ8082226.1 RNA-binding protein [Nostoc sp. DcaGUA01]MDZ8242022.1 RNA-binding protein [Nostoc sp. ChiQUE01a]
MSVRLYIGNLPKEEIDRQDLQAVFAAEGDAVTTKLIKDRKTGKCRGFGFLTVNNDEQADQIIEKYNGQMFKDTPIKLEKALPRTKGEEGEEQAPKAVNVASSNPTPSANKESRREKGSKKPRRGGGGGGSRESSTTTESDAIRPDPRWASELEKLKQMLAAQTTN